MEGVGLRIGPVFQGRFYDYFFRFCRPKRASSVCINYFHSLWKRPFAGTSQYFRFRLLFLMNNDGAFEVSSFSRPFVEVRSNDYFL